MTEEHRIQNEILAACSEYAILFRVNVVRGKSRDGRYISSGVPAGYADLSGVRFSDGKAVFIEVKKPTGRVSTEQRNFLHQMQKAGAIAGVCRSADEAVKLIEGGGKDDKRNPAGIPQHGIRPEPDSEANQAAERGCTNGERLPHRR